MDFYIVTSRFLEKNIANPLDNPIFYPVLIRLIILYLVSFILLFIRSKFKLNYIFKDYYGKQFLLWLIIGPIYLLLILSGEYTGLLALLAMIFLALREIYKITKINKLYFYMLCFLSIFSIYIVDKKTELFYMLPLMYFTSLISVAIKQNSNKSFKDLILSLFVSIWIIFSLSHFVLLGKLNFDKLDHTGFLLITIIFSVALSDLFSHMFNDLKNIKPFNINLLNKRIASNLSYKTYLNIIGNIIGSFLGIIIMYFQIIKYLPFYQLIILSILIGTNDFLGEITAKMFKKYFNINKPNTIIDLIDSYSRVVIAIYYYLVFIIH